jgi:VanZ family protein
MALIVIYAVSDEFHQSFTPGREPKLRDVLIDTAGSFLGMYLTLKTKQIKF